MPPRREKTDTGGQRKEISVAGYKIGPRLGAGATGTVFSATHPETNHEVAVKIIHRHLAADTTVQEDFLKEISRIAAFKHPRILPLEAVGQFDSGEIFVISDMAQGLPLTDLMSDSGPLPMVEAIPLLDSLAEILGDLHDQGLVHGNLSPENIWLDPKEDGRWPPSIQILDFGMSMLHRPERMEDEARPPYYLGPEQIRGEEPSKSTDVYAFGVIAYQMLTGRLPFSSPRLGEVLLMHLNDDPPPPGDIVPMNPETELFLFQALSKDPNYRFKDMHHIRESILVILPRTQKVAAAVPESAEKIPVRVGGQKTNVTRGHGSAIPPELPDVAGATLLPIGDAPTLAAHAEYPALEDRDIEDGPTNPLSSSAPPEEIAEAGPLPPLDDNPIEDGPTPVFTYKSLITKATGAEGAKEGAQPAEPEQVGEEEEIEEIDLDQEEEIRDVDLVQEEEPEAELVEEVTDEDVEVVSEEEDSQEVNLDANVPAGKVPLGPVEDDEPTWRRSDAISMADTEEVSGIIQAPDDRGSPVPVDELVIVAEEVSRPMAPPTGEQKPVLRKDTPRPGPPPVRGRRSSGARPVADHADPERPRYALAHREQQPESDDFDLEEICFSGPHIQPPAPLPEPTATGFIPQQLVPLLSAIAGILTALSMGVVGYWLVTGQWPFPLGQ